MKSYWAIVKLTFRNALRSHIFQLLLLLLLLAVIVIPTTVSGDGTAGGFIRVSLLYSLVDGQLHSGAVVGLARMPCDDTGHR